MAHNQNKEYKTKKFKEIDEFADKLQEAVDSKDSRRIREFIDSMLSQVDFMLNEMKKDKTMCIHYSHLSRIALISPRVGTEEIKAFNRILKKRREDIIYERDAFLRIKSCLKGCRKKEKYNKLPELFDLIIGTTGLRDERIKELEIDANHFSYRVYGKKDDSDNNVKELRQLMQ